MSANGWSVAVNVATGALIVAGVGMMIIVGLGMMMNDDRSSFSNKPRRRWEILLAAWVALVLLVAPAIGILSYRSMVWDCENGTRNSQCRPEDKIIHNDVNVDLNVDGPS